MLLIKHDYNFNDVSKNGYSRSSWNNGILKKGYDLIICVYDVTNKILPRDLNYIVDWVMSPKFGNSSISLREIIITSIL